MFRRGRGCFHFFGLITQSVVTVYVGTIKMSSEKLMSQFDINAGHIGRTAYESMAGELFSA